MILVVMSDNKLVNSLDVLLLEEFHKILTVILFAAVNNGGSFAASDDHAVSLADVHEGDLDLRELLRARAVSAAVSGISLAGLSAVTGHRSGHDKCKRDSC